MLPIDSLPLFPKLTFPVIPMLLASYAELNCDGKATALYTGIKVGFSTLCVDKEVTYEFVEDVIREISEMSPAHISTSGAMNLLSPQRRTLTVLWIALWPL